MRCAEGAKAFVLGVEHWTLGDYIQTIDATNIMASEFIFSCQVPSPFLRSHAGRRQKIYQKGVNHLFFRNFIILWAQRRYLGHWKRSSWQVESHGHYMKACCAFLKTLPVVKKELNFLYSKRFNLTHLMRRFFYYDPFPSHQNMDSFYYCPFRSFPNFLFHVGSLHWKYLQSPEVEGNKWLFHEKKTFNVKHHKRVSVECKKDLRATVSTHLTWLDFYHTYLFKWLRL